MSSVRPHPSGDLLAQLEAQIGTAGFAQILDNLAEAVTIREPDDQIVYANRAAIESMGFSSLDELRSRPPGVIFDDYIVEDEAGRPITMQEIPSVRLLSGSPAGPLVIRITHRSSGQVRWVVLKSAPMRESDGSTVAAVTIIEDVTAQKGLELRDRFLSEATATLMSSLDYEETLLRVARLAVPEVADWCAVDLVAEPGTRRQVAVAHRDPAKASLAAELERLRPTGLDPEYGIGRVIRTGESELYPLVTEEMVEQTPLSPEYVRLLREVGMRSVLVCPLRSRGRNLGAITLVNAESRRSFGESDKGFAEALAARAAVAIDNAKLATERREIAVTLQQSLLPGALPAIDGWQVAAIYRPGRADGEIEVGGDFYDFIPTGEGWIVLLGDVTGKDLEAAAMTALMRHGARFLARQSADPGAIFAELDEALRDRAGLSLCTAVCARLEDDGAVIAVAGHPPPLILRDDGRLREIGVGGAILGAWAGEAWTSRSFRIGSDETLVLYTDGITDAPGVDDRFGIDRLRALLIERAGASPEELVDALQARLEAFQTDGPNDDTAVLALRPTGNSS